MTVQDLPVLNACLNSSVVAALISGFIAIKKQNKKVHVICMLIALVLSISFLSSYLIYHYHVGSKGFQGQGVVRTVYFTILISHTILAMVNLPMIILTFFRAFKGDWERHKKIARLTFPIWLYVSFTGVLVYMMLYQWFA